MKTSYLAYLRYVLRFDETKRIPGTRQYRIRCSCCAACSVNGIPIHERTCPNDTRECTGCSAIIPANQKYCEECKQ